MQLDLSGVVLAAGEGKRMRSGTSKVLFQAAGRPLLAHPLLRIAALGARRAVVVASPKNEAAIGALLGELARDLTGLACTVALQERQLGTGDAVRAALVELPSEWTLILYGDGPLILEADLEALCSEAEKGQVDLALLTCELDDPSGYGRIIQSQGRVIRIREERDLASAEERAIKLVNPGIYLVRTALLRDAIESLQPNNAQGEYYLTDVVEYASQRGAVAAVPGDASALLGVNDRAQLRDVELRLFRRIAERHARAGVTVHGDPFIDDTVEIEPDAEIGNGVELRGRSRVAAGARIETGSVIVDSEVEPRAWVKPYCVVQQSRVGEGASCGPFAQLRPGSVIEREAHVGNFVELKQATLGPFAKANHLAYLGDVDIGSGTNVGAGTIVCNYDGFSKHRSTIGKDAFIGSDSQLISPVTIGDGAYVATGSTITEDVPSDALAIGRTRQTNKPGYASALRERLKAKKPTR